jgi:hypothetical protein
MAKTLAQLEADWATQGKIAALNAKLAIELDDAKRAALEKLIAIHKAAITPD